MLVLDSSGLPRPRSWHGLVMPAGEGQHTCGGEGQAWGEAGQGSNDSRWHRLARMTSSLYLPRQALQALRRSWGVYAAAHPLGQPSIPPGVTLSGLQVESVLQSWSLSGLHLQSIHAAVFSSHFTFGQGTILNKKTEKQMGCGFQTSRLQHHDRNQESTQWRL